MRKLGLLFAAIAALALGSAATMERPALAEAKAKTKRLSEGFFESLRDIGKPKAPAAKEKKAAKPKKAAKKPTKKAEKKAEKKADKMEKKAPEKKMDKKK